MLLLPALQYRDKNKSIQCSSGRGRGEGEHRKAITGRSAALVLIAGFFSFEEEPAEEHPF
jgi:hypothetical protein